MDIPKSQDSSSSTDGDRKYCSQCKSRMSSVSFDHHLICITCRGHDCDYQVRCSICTDWSEDHMTKYMKHRKSLVSKSRAKKERKELKVKEKSGVDTSSTSSNVSALDSGKSSEQSHVSEDRVMQLITSSLSDFSKSLASSMQESFTSIVRYPT